MNHQTPEQLFAQAWAAHQNNQWDQAQILYQQIIAKDEKHVDARQLLGVLFHQLGYPQKAFEQLFEAIALKPDNESLHNNLGSVLETQGNFDQAIHHYTQALKIQPDYPAAHYNLGSLLHKQEKLDQAIAHYRQALKAKPDYVEAHNNLANALKDSGQLKEASEHYQHALSHNPNFAQGHSNLGNLCCDQGQFDQAATHYLKALKIQPDLLSCRYRLIDILGCLSPQALTIELKHEVERCLRIPQINKQDLGLAIITFISGDPECFSFLEHVRKADLSVLENQYQQGQLHNLFAHRWIHYLLEHTYLSYPLLEMVFTKLRRVMLKSLFPDAAQARALTSAIDFTFACHLALHCSNNEFIFATSPEEKVLHQRLAKDLGQDIEENQVQSTLGQLRLVIFSLYAPLSALKNYSMLTNLEESPWDPSILPLIKRHLKEAQEEERLKNHLTPLGQISNDTSLRVKQQYDENPFPRWLALSRHTEPRQASQVLQHLFPHFQAPNFLKEPVNLLIAGCGTGQHAFQSESRFINKYTLAVDLSASSLAYALRKSKELDLEHIDFRLGDILNLKEVTQQFEVIESIGVLHHLKDPMAGWQILTALLRPGGVMKIGLYSEKARDAIKALREIIAQKNLDSSPENIREFRQEILKNQDPVLKDVIRYGDFYNMSTCRDLLFHVQEHRYTLSQIAQCLEELKLKFIGFEFFDPSIKKHYQQQFPQDTTLTNLDFWEQFENENTLTFQQCYQFWCQKL